MEKGIEEWDSQYAEQGYSNQPITFAEEKGVSQNLTFLDFICTQK